MTRLSPHLRRGVLGAVGLLASMIAPISPAQPRDGALADAALQRNAEMLQRCLEAQLAPSQIESTVSTEGRLADTVRITRWSTVSKSSACTSGMAVAQGTCEARSGLQRVVALDFAVGEAHPAWSANDRARLEDLIPSTLENVAGPVRLQPSVSRGADGDREILRVRLEYRGMSALQRDVEEWVRGPRELTVVMTLVDPAEGHRVLATRNLTLRQSPQILDRYTSTSSARWITKLLESIDTTAKEVVAPLACDTPWLSVTADRGKMWLRSDQYVGLREGRAVLLVPTADSALASRWPIARVRTASEGGSAELELIRGASDLCESGCKAIPL